MISQKRVLSTFLELVRINAPARAERPVADYLKKALREYKPKEDGTAKKLGGNAGNIIVRVPGAGKHPVLLSAHMDTVAPTAGIRIRRRAGIVRTDGRTILGADDRAGISMILELLRHLKERGKPHPPLELVFTAAEEIGLQGSRYIPKSALKAKMGYVLDSSLPIGLAVHRCVTIYRMDIRVKGRAAHGGVEPDKGVNAIAIAAKALSKIPTGRLARLTTLNVGMIRGGHAFNIVPADARIEIEMRSDSMHRLKALRRRVRTTFEKAARAQGGKVKIREWSDFKAFQISRNAKVARCLLAGALTSGNIPGLRAYGGGSDANNFNKLGIPSLVLGTGYSFPHTPKERMPIKALVRGTKLLEGILDASRAMP